MTSYDFDKPIERRNSDSYKWDANRRVFGKADLLPFWVADMDFAIAPRILRAVKYRLQHPVFGYAERSDEYIDCVVDWLQCRHRWEIPRDWLKFCPPSSIVGMYGLLTTATTPGCSVLVPTPTYGPLMGFVEQTGRRMIRCPLRKGASRFVLDLHDIRGRIEADTEMLVICSPHNPTGRVFDQSELEGLCEIAEAHDLILVSDEVHADLARPGYQHRPLGSFGYQKSVTVISPNKAFNTAGLPQSSLVIPDQALRETLQCFLNTVQVNHDSTFGGVAMMAAYQHCGDWLDAVIRYIDTNHRHVDEFVSSEIAGLRVWPAEATYLAWLDYRETGLSEIEMQERLVNRGGVALYNGTLFGEEGRGFLRMNIACPRQTLTRGLTGIREALAR